MSPQLWATVVVAAFSIAVQAVAAFVVVRVAVAVLNEKLNGHKEATGAHFVSMEKHLENTDAEVNRLRERSHVHANTLTVHDGRIRQLEAEVRRN